MPIMAVYKRFDGRKLTSSRDPNWGKGRWYMRKKIDGRLIHKALPLAQTKEDAEKAETAILRGMY